eukprot:6205177-Pleurochrysis_carterae.AAC.1
MAKPWPIFIARSKTVLWGSHTDFGGATNKIGAFRAAAISLSFSRSSNTHSLSPAAAAVACLLCAQSNFKHLDH